MRALVLALTLISIGCSSPSKQDAAAPAAEKNYFPNMKGCFLLYDMQSNAYTKVIGEENCRERFVACSSFKVPLAVMAFDSGVLKDEKQVLKWDGKKEEREALNRDHDAKSWMQDSVVWFSQRLTPRIGQKRLKKYLADFNYGNQDLKGGILQAWLIAPSATGPALKVSAYEQADFMKRLFTDTLPVSKRSMQLTREITDLGKSEKGAQLHGKTGSNFYNGNMQHRLGWFIAHVSMNGKSYVAVTNFSDLSPTTEKGYGGFKAKEITLEILRDQGLW